MCLDQPFMSSINPRSQIGTGDHHILCSGHMIYLKKVARWPGSSGQVSDDWSLVLTHWVKVLETYSYSLEGSASDICKEVTRMEMIVDIGGEGRATLKESNSALFIFLKSIAAAQTQVGNSDLCLHVFAGFKRNQFVSFPWNIRPFTKILWTIVITKKDTKLPHHGAWKMHFRWILGKGNKKHRQTSHGQLHKGSKKPVYTREKPTWDLKIPLERRHIKPKPTPFFWVWHMGSRISYGWSPPHGFFGDSSGKLLQGKAPPPPICKGGKVAGGVSVDGGGWGPS